MFRIGDILSKSARTAAGKTLDVGLRRLYSYSTRHVDGAHVFDGLHTFSLGLGSLTARRDAPRSVTLVLPELDAAKVFAGIYTAIGFGCHFAAAAGLPLRIIGMRVRSAAMLRAALDYVRREFASTGATVSELVDASRLPELVASDRDVWIATHWATAHMLDVACRLGRIDSSNVVYLVQDYEPGFFAWSSDYVLARSTYRAGFQLVINSTPLQKFLEAENVNVDGSLVFAPDLDLDRLADAARARRKAQSIRFLFYGRPSKPRNLFGIGVASLRLTARHFERTGVQASFVSAGETHASTALGDAHVLFAKGKVPWSEYFALLSQSDVVLSLQQSPHPSHPPLDAVTSGAYAVTNELGGTRAGLHERLLVSEADPAALSEALVSASQRVLAGGCEPFDPSFLAKLGRDIRSVAGSAAARLSA